MLIKKNRNLEDFGHTTFALIKTPVYSDRRKLDKSQKARGHRNNQYSFDSSWKKSHGRRSIYPDCLLGNRSNFATWTTVSWGGFQVLLFCLSCLNIATFAKYKWRKNSAILQIISRNFSNPAISEAEPNTFQYTFWSPSRGFSVWIVLAWRPEVRVTPAFHYSSCVLVLLWRSWKWSQEGLIRYSSGRALGKHWEDLVWIGWELSVGWRSERVKVKDKQACGKQIRKFSHCLPLKFVCCAFIVRCIVGCRAHAWSEILRV